MSPKFGCSHPKDVCVLLLERMASKMTDTREPELVEYPGGTKEWSVDGKLHRLDGPAVEYSNGWKHWFVNGKRHRLDGPAIEYPDGHKEWYIFGKEYLDKELYEVTSSILLMLFPDLRTNR